MMIIKKEIHWFFMACVHFNIEDGDVFTMNDDEVTCPYCKAFLKRNNKE